MSSVDDDALLMAMAQFPLVMADLVQRISRQPGLSQLRRQHLMDIHDLLTAAARDAVDGLSADAAMKETLDRLQRTLATVDDAMDDLQAALESVEDQ